MVLAARTESDLMETARMCEERGLAKDRLWTLAVDLGSPAGVDILARFASEKLGFVTVLVNNAGKYVSGNASEGDPDEWDEMMRGARRPRSRGVARRGPRAPGGARAGT